MGAGTMLEGLTGGKGAAAKARAPMALPALLAVGLAVSGAAWNAVLSALAPEKLAGTVAQGVAQAAARDVASGKAPDPAKAAGGVAGAAAGAFGNLTGGKAPTTPKDTAAGISHGLDGGRPRTPGEAIAKARDIQDTVRDAQAATKAFQHTLGFSGFVLRWGGMISKGLQGACLGATAVLLSTFLLRARTGKGRAAAVVGMSLGAVATEPLVFLGQWVPAGLFEGLTKHVQAGLESTTGAYLRTSAGTIEAAALGAGIAFPAAILAVRGLLFVTGRHTRGAVWSCALVGVPVLAIVRFAQQFVAPLPGGGVALRLEGVDYAATGVTAACAAAFAWLALAWSHPRGAGDPVTAVIPPAPGPPAPPAPTR